MLNYEFPPLGGGAGNANYYLLREFARVPDLRIDLVTSSATDALEESQFADSICVFRLPVGKGQPHFWTVAEIWRWFVRTQRFARRLTAEHRYDLCHCWSGWPSGLIGYRLRKRTPYLVALRGSDVPGYNPRLRYLDPLLFRPLSRVVWDSASAVTCVSRSQARLAARTAPAISPVIIGNGIDTGRFAPGPAPERFTILFVGRLVERKGLPFLFRAVAELTAEGRDCRVVIAGSGPDHQKLSLLGRKLDIDDRVEMLGNVPHAELPRIYADASVFVLPAIEEAMSNALLEAMASGLPLVTTPNGITDLLDGNGAIVAPRNDVEIRHALLRYMDDPELRRRHGEKSRAIAQTIGWSNVTDAYLRLYEQVLDPSAKKATGEFSSTFRS